MAHALEITPATQYATLYVDGRPVATLARRRVYTEGPAWIAYALDGSEVRRFWLGGIADYMARETLKALACREACHG